MKNRKECGKIYRRNPLFKRLAVLLVLLFCVEGVWGTPFRWKKSTENSTSSSGNTNWDTPKNWDYYGRYLLSTGWHEEGTNYPGSNASRTDDVYFFGEADSVCVVNVTVPPANAIGTMYVNFASSNAGGIPNGVAGSKKLELQFQNNNIVTVGSVEVAGGEFYLTGTGTLNVKENLNIAAGASLVIDEDVTLQVSDITNSGTIIFGSITGSGNITNSGTISCGSISCNALNQAASGTIKDFTSITADSIGSGGNRFSGTLTPSSDATITVTNAFYNACEISDSATTSLQISADGLDTNTTGKISLTNASSSVTLKGALIDTASGSSYKKVIATELNHVVGGGSIFYAQFGTAKIEELEITNGDGKGFELNGGNIGKLTWTSANSSTLSFASDTTIKEINISGSGIGSELTVTGSGTITALQNNFGLQYLNFTSSTEPQVTGAYFAVKDSQSPGGVFPSGWEEESGDFTWTGSVDSAWNKPGNWDTGTVPGRTSKVIIPDCSVINKPNTGNNVIEVRNLNISSGGELICDNGTLTVSEELLIKSNGKLSVTGGNVKVLCDFEAVSGTKISLTGGKLAFWKNVDFSKMTSTDWENTNGTIYWYNNSTAKNTVKVFQNQEFKTVNFAGNLEIQLNGTVKADTFNMGVDNSLCPYLTDANIPSKQFTAEIKNGTKLEVTNNMDVSRSATGSVIGLCQVNVNAEFKGGITSYSGTIFLADSGKTITLGANFIHSATNADLPTRLQVKGTLNGEGHDIILSTGSPKYYSSKLIVDRANSEVKAKNIKFDSTYNNGINDSAETIAVVNYGKISVTGNFETPSYSETGSVSLNGNDSSLVNKGNAAFSVSSLILDSVADSNRKLDGGSNGITVGSVNAKKTGLSLTTENNITITATDNSSKAINFISNSGKLTLNGNTSASGISVKSGAEFTTASDVEITLSGDLDNKGTFTSSGTVLINKSGTVAVSGNNSFKNLNINPDPDAALTVSFEAGKTQTVSGNFVSEGQDGKLITLTAAGTPDADNNSTWWSLNVPASNISLSYTNIEYSSSINEIQKDWGTTVSESVPFSTSNWFLRKYYWFGKDTTDNTSWAQAANWSTKGNPYTASSVAPLTSSSYIEVCIQENSEGILKLTSDVEVKSFEVNSGTKVNLNGNKLTAQSFTNSGTVSLGGGAGTTLNIGKSYENGSSGTIVSEGTEAVTLPNLSVSGNTITESGTWEFTGGNIPVFPGTGKNYNALVINGDVTLGTAISAVSTEIKSGKSLSLGNNILSLTGALTNSGTLNINGSGAVTTGSVTNSGTIDISGSGTIDKLNSTSGLVKYSGAASQTIQSFTYYNLELANTSSDGLSVSADVTVSNALTVSKNSIVTIADGKSFSVSGKTDTANGAETLTLSGTGSATFTGAVGSTKTFASVTSSASSLTFGSTVSIGTLIIDGDTTLLPGSSAEVTNITINSGKKLTSSGNIKLTGTFSDLNTSESGLSSTGTVIFTGTDSKIVTSSDRTKFYNIFVSKGKSLSTTYSFEVGGNFTVEADAGTPPTPGTFTATGGTIVFSGTSKTVSGVCNFYNVTFGEDSSISLTAGNTFNDLTFEKGSVVTFAADTEQTVNGKIVSNGTGGNSVTLKSESGYWNINFDQNYAGNKLEYLNITNSNFTGSNGPAVALYSSDGGNNTAWIFPGQSYTWTAGASDSDKTKWDVKENWNPKTVPGKGAVVTIPNGKSKYPVLESDLDLYYSSSAKGYITIDADGVTPGSLDLGIHSLKAGEVTNNGVLRLEGSDLKLDKLSNNGLLKLNGNERFGTHGAVSEFGVASVISGDSSTVEYYGTTASASGWLEKSDGYKKLLIDSGTEFTAASYTRVPDPLAAPVETKVTKAVSLTNNGKVIVPSGITLEFGSYTGTSDVIEITDGTINHTGSADAVIGNLKVTTKVTLNGTTTSNKNLSLISTVYNSSEIATTGNVQISGTQNSDVAGNVSVSSGNLKVAESFSCDSVTIESSGKLFSGSSIISVSGDWTDNNATDEGFDCESGTVVFSSSSPNITEPCPFNNLKTSAAATVTLNKTLTVNGTYKFDDSVTLSGGDNKIIFEGAVSGTGNLTLSSSVDVKASVTSTGEQTYLKAVTVYNTPTLNASKINISSSVSKSGEDNKLIFNSPEVVSTNAVINLPLEVIQDTVISGNAITINGGSVSSGTHTQTYECSLSSGQPLSLTGSGIFIANNVSGNDVSINGNVTIPSGKTVQIDCNVLDLGNFTNNGTLTFGTGKTLTLHENLTNAGQVTAPINLILTGLTQTEISGLYEFENLSILNNDTSSVKKVVFPASDRTDGKGIRITGNFTVTGENLASPETGKNILIKSSFTSLSEIDTEWWWLESVDVSKVTVINAEICNAYAASDISSKVINCVESRIDNGAYTTYHWFAGHQFYWHGAENNSWTTSGNWSTFETGTPVLSVSPRIDDETALITLKKGSLSGNENLLILENDIVIKSLTVESGVRINLKNYSVTGDNILNLGTVALQGNRTSPFIVNNGGTISHDPASFVEFVEWGSGTINATYSGLGLNGSFKNLILTDLDPFDFTENVVLYVNGSFVSNAQVGTVNPLSGIQIDGTSVLNGGKILTTGNQIYSGNVTVGAVDSEFTAGSSEVPGNIVFEKDVTGSLDHVLAFNGNVQFVKTIEEGNASLAALKVIFNNSLSGNNLKISADSEFNGNVSLIALDVVGSGKLNCEQIETTNIMEFEKEVELATDVKARSSSGEIIFDSEVKGNGFDFTILSKANLKNNVSDVKNFTSENLLISDNCVSIKTTGNQNYEGTVTFNTNLDLNGKQIYLKDSFNGESNNLSVNAERFTVSGKITTKNILANCYLILESNSGSPSHIQVAENLELNNGFDFVNAEIVTGGDVLVKSDGKIASAKIENSGSFVLSSEKKISVSGNLSQTGEGQNLIYGSIVTSEAATVDFAQNVLVSGNPESPLIFGGEAGVLDLKENIIISLDSSEKELKLLSPLQAKNIVLYKGLISVSKDISSIQDIVLIGKNYSHDDGSAEHAGEYKYTKNRKADFLYKNFDENILPECDGKLLVSPGISISAGKNFYANGLSLSGSEGEWYLDVDKNADPDICFVEAYNCDISNSVVRYKKLEEPLNSKGVAEACTFDGGKKWDSADYENCGTNRNWSFADFSIRYVSTVSDNVLYVELSEPIRNLYGEFKQSIGSVFFNNNGTNEGFVKIYSSFRIVDEKGTVEAVELRDDEEVSSFYLETQNDSDSRWNTDAFGKGSGNEFSTDSHGRHQNSIPSLLFTRTLSAPVYNFTNKYGKILINSGIVYENTEDKTSPVLLETVVGQESHKLYDSSVGLESQPSYDAHNFLEFRYSEAVDFNNSNGGGTLIQNAYTTASSVNYFENQKVDSLLGAVSQNESGLLVSGLASIQKGRLLTGASGISDNEVHALYRKPGMTQHSVRLSIAGYTSGFVADNAGLQYKNWTGYIDYSETPSGEVTLPGGRCDYIFDQNGNVLSLINLEGVQIKKSSAYSNEKDYGSWDVSKPVFAAYRKASFPWTEPGDTENYESVGSTVDGTSSLKRIEFHLFDNTPTYSDQEAQWVSKQGWVHPYDYTVKVHPILYTEDSYAADDFGGARAFESSNRTSGGIRYSSICEASDAFRYVVGVDKDPDIPFAEGVKAYYGASSPIFQAADNPSRNPDKVDGVYFGYKLPETILSLKTQFTVSYDNTKGYVTDLAGNRLDSAKIRTMDLTPPSINMTLAPVGQNKIYVMFSKKLELEAVSLQTSDGSVTTMDPLSEALPRAFGLYTIQDGGSLTESEGNNIDSSVPARILYQNNNYMGIELTLKQNVTYEDIMNLYLVVKKEETHYKDPVIDLSTTYATFIQDDTGIGNYVSAFTAHALSDFAVNLVNPLYAYNENFDDGDSKIHTGLYGEGSFGVHDFNEEQMNFGSLIAKEEIHVIASVNDEKLLNQNEFNARIYIDNSPDEKSISTEYNRAADTKLRVWLPEIAGAKTFSPIANAGNTDYFVFDSTFVRPGDLSENLDFKISKSASETWNAGDQISFLFGLTDKNGNPLKVVHVPVFDYSTEIFSLLDTYPMFALRLKTPGDLSSLDLWSIRLRDIINQKGNVTILNNVIDSAKGEKTVVKIDNPKAGKVDIIVMTLDGNVIDYLNHGNLEEGTSYFTWNGRNRSGKACARGMYFVRVIGNGFDETRKVMVVK
ncbi:MAG: hypothetical protein MJ182_01370 [Treponema sp.]|nr:hypothetical protein [Treponema sp.]